jgi:acyl-CoA thioesterase FadM
MKVVVHAPLKILYTVELPVRITDLNYAGHVGNDSVLSLVHEARVQFLTHLGMGGEKGLPGEPGLIMRDAAIMYKAEIFYGETVLCRMGVADVSSYGFDIIFSLSAKSTGKELARVKTGMACFDYENRKLAPLSQSLRARI